MEPNERRQEVMETICHRRRYIRYGQKLLEQQDR